MMNFLKKTISVLFLLCVWNACVEDNTVYNLKDLNQVTIENLQNRYSVMLYNRLQIAPTIKTSHNDDSKLSYVWYAYTAVTRDEADTLSHDRNLDILVEPAILTPGEDYTLVLRITDDETGVYYQEDMKLEVATQFTKGTIFLCEDNGEAELNFLQDNDKKTFLEGIYKEANKEIVGKNPQRIISLNPNQYAPFMKQEYIWCNDENGGVIASPLSFEKVKTMREAFDVTPTDEVLNFEYYFKGMMIEYIIMNGALHKRGTNMQAITWEPALVLMTEPAQYDIAPDVLFPTGTPVFFDELHGRLITHATWNMAALKTLTKSATDPQVFDPNNLGEGMKLKCWGALSEPATGAWMLLEDSKTGEYWIYKFSYGSEFSSISKTKITETLAPNMKKAVAFAVNQNMKDIFVYATSDAIYSFTVSQLTNDTSIQLEVLQKDMKADQMEVTGLEFEDITLPAPTADDPDATRISSQVRVYVRDLSLGEKQGGAVFFEMNTTGGVHLEQIFKKTGFCDRVIDIDEKYS